jgi:hypothetical protein
MSLTLHGPNVGSAPLPHAVNVRLVAAAPALWRIVDRSGRVIGHLQAVTHGDDIRYRARRFHTPSRAFRDLGEFWSAEDAVECVRLAR